MKVRELFEIWGDADHSRNEIDWQREVTNRAANGLYGLFDKNGKRVRAGMTKAAAEMLQGRADLVKKHGKLTVKPE